MFMYNKVVGYASASLIEARVRNWSHWYAMRKKLDTRFPAVRIKKIMQADEDVGKIAMAVPLLVSKALELFLQDLCDRTYEITLKRGAKTVNSLHLKQCVQSFNVFDFLKDTVSKVPDLGGSDAATEDRSAAKRRKVSEDEECGNDDESKRIHTPETVNTSSSGRGRGRRGRGRGRGRGSRMLERDSIGQHEKIEDDPNMFHLNGEDQEENLRKSDNVAGLAESRPIVGKSSDKSVRNFDLNIDLNVTGDSTPKLAGAPPPDSSTKPTPCLKNEEIPGWSLDDMKQMAIDPIQLTNLNGTIDEEDEDYDEEG